MARILLVEDNEMNRELMVRRLSKRGYTVLVAEDGQEAVDKTKSERPDLVLMDMGLPVISGLDATIEIKKDPDVCGIPVIGLTAHAMESARQEAMAAGCDDYVTKPVDFERLLAVMNRFLGGGTAG